MTTAKAPAPKLEGFALERALGSGGFADVFLYRQHLPDREVAVKVLHDGVSDRTAASFTAEANVMARLSAHPSIVTVYQAAIAPDGRPYLVMEYYPRPNLNVRSRARPLPVDDALDIAIRIAGAVETAHRFGIIHRDIKPANILTSAYGRPGLTDFGISAAKTDLADRDSGLSIPWCAPEVIEGRSAGDERSDVYSLAATLFSLLAGRSPFEIPGQRNSQVDLLSRMGMGGPIPLDRPDVPAGLRRVIQMGLDPEPGHRPQSTAAFARMLQEVEVQLHLAVTPLEVQKEGRDHDDLRPDDGEAATRVRGATVVRPSSATDPRLIDGVPEEPSFAGAVPLVPASPVPAAPGLEDTVLRGTPQQPTFATDPGPDRQPRRRALVRWVGLAAAAAAMGGIGITVMNGGSTPPPGTAPVQDQDAVVTSVPVPTDLSITRTGPATATAAWSVVDGQPEDWFQWERFGAAVDRGSAAEPTLTIDGLAEGESLCLRVWLVRANGQRSASPAEGCEA